MTPPKVATKKRQNRQLAEFCQSALTKLVEGQILCEKLVSQALFESPSPKWRKGKNWPIMQFEFSRPRLTPARSTLKSMPIFSYMYTLLKNIKSRADRAGVSVSEQFQKFWSSNLLSKNAKKG